MWCDDENDFTILKQYLKFLHGKGYVNFCKLKQV